MKKFIVAIALIAVVGAGSVKAQEAEITKDDLYKYALLQQVVELMKKDVSNQLMSMIDAQEGISRSRYVELSKGEGEPATEFENKFLALVNEMKEERTQAIVTVNKELATKMVGNNGKTYNAIKDALKTDEELKAQYDEIAEMLAMKSDEDA